MQSNNTQYSGKINIWLYFNVGSSSLDFCTILLLQRLLNVLNTLTRKYVFFTIIIKIDCAKCKIEALLNIRYTVVSPSKIEQFQLIFYGITLIMHSYQFRLSKIRSAQRCWHNDHYPIVRSFPECMHIIMFFISSPLK